MFSLLTYIQGIAVKLLMAGRLARNVSEPAAVKGRLARLLAAVLRHAASAVPVCPSIPVRLL